MSIFSDMGDGFRKWKADKPQYETQRFACEACRSSGKCPQCNGRPSSTGKTLSRSVFIVVIGLSLSNCSGLLGSYNIGTGFVLFFAAIAAYLWVSATMHCICQYSASDQANAGKCRKCEGKGYTEQKFQVGGTKLLDAISNAEKASELIRNALVSSNHSSLAFKAAIDSALKLSPHHFVGNAIRGLLYARDGQFDHAIEHLKRADSRKPKNVEIKNAMCAVYDAMGDRDRAEMMFVRAVALGLKARDREIMLRDAGMGAVSGAAAGLFLGLVGTFAPFVDE